MYIFVGVPAEDIFRCSRTRWLSPNKSLIQRNKAEVLGAGDEKWQITTESDCAEFTVELIRDETKAFAVYRICSIEHGIKEIRKIYEKEKGTMVQLRTSGSIEDRESLQKARRRDGSPKILGLDGYIYQL